MEGTEPIEDLVKKWAKEMQNAPLEYFDNTPKKYFMDIASKAKYDTIDELLRNADKVERWVRGI